MRPTLARLEGLARLEAAAVALLAATGDAGDEARHYLDLLAEREEPAVIAEILRRIAHLQAGVDEVALEDAIARGDLAAAESLIPWGSFTTETAAAIEGLILHVAAMGAAEVVRREAPKLAMRFAFDRSNPAVVHAAQRRAAELVREMEDDGKARIRDLVVLGLNAEPKAYKPDGTPLWRTPRETARSIREGLGLTQRQESYVQSFEARLHEIAGGAKIGKDDWARLRRAGVAHNGRAKIEREGLSDDRIDRLISGYRARLVRDRAATIARTETMAAANAGHLAAWRQMADTALIHRATAAKKWLAAPGACPICAALDGQVVPLDTPFPGGHDGGNAHPNCRCVVVLVRQ